MAIDPDLAVAIDAIEGEGNQFTLCRRIEREMLANQSALEFYLHGLALVGNLLLRSLGMLR